MKFMVKLMLPLLMLFCLIISCEKDASLAQELTVLSTATTEMMLPIKTKNASLDNTVIVLSAPSIYNDYYQFVFQDIVDYQVNFVNLAIGSNKVIILVDTETKSYYDGRIPASNLLVANIDDIWIRDFSPVIPSLQAKFNYLPDYQTRSTANLIDNSFERWFKKSGLTYGEKSRLILDGGNVVDNGSDRIIITDRFLYDNPRYTKAAAVTELKKLTGVKQVAIIPEFPGDATGHSDGMLMFSTANKILLHEMPRRLQRRTIKELESAFPGIEIVVVPDYYKDEEWQGFSSACNIFVNSLVTDQYIYMPTFKSGYDAEYLQLVKANTDKTVIPVPAESVCFMGGSVRCLSWQVKGVNANRLIELAK